MIAADIPVLADYNKIIPGDASRQIAESSPVFFSIPRPCAFNRRFLPGCFLFCILCRSQTGRVRLFRCWGELKRAGTAFESAKAGLSRRVLRSAARLFYEFGSRIRPEVPLFRDAGSLRAVNGRLRGPCGFSDRSALS